MSIPIILRAHGSPVRPGVGIRRLGARFIRFTLFAVAVLIGMHIGASIFSFTRLFHAHAGIALSQADALDAFSHRSNEPVQIPHIVHQVFHNWADPGNDSLPDDWAAARHHCLDLNPKWEFKLWTESASRAFIQAEYPWFLETYDSYRLPVQRVDAIRYFVLDHYGGVYMDLDNGCLNELDPLTYYPLWIADPGSGALNNNLIGSKPHHPFWTFVLHSLYAYNYDYVLSFPTVHSTTGQWFITRVWEKYHSLLPVLLDDTDLASGRLYRLMVDPPPSAQCPSRLEPLKLSLKDVFFTQERGGTWNQWDSAVFLWIGDRLFPTCLVAISLTTILVFWGCRGRFVRGHIKSSPLREKNLDQIV